MILCPPRRASQIWGWNFNPSLGPALPCATATHCTWTPPAQARSRAPPAAKNCWLLNRIFRNSAARTCAYTEGDIPRTAQAARPGGESGGGTAPAWWPQRCSHALNRSSPWPGAAPGSRSGTWLGPEGVGRLSHPGSARDRLWRASPLQDEAAISLQDKP